MFLRTRERFGGLSNMAGGYPLEVNGVVIKSSEALYQACRFPHMPKVQCLIVEQASAMASKIKSRRFRRLTRPDWDDCRVRIMAWCIRVKLLQHRGRFGALLMSTGDQAIVEESSRGRDVFWGTRAIGDDLLEGCNVLGKLLTELRDAVRDGAAPTADVDPPDIDSFLLFGVPIGATRPRAPAAP